MDDLNSRHQTEFHLKSTFWLSVTAATLILPFAFYHLTHQHVGIGIGAVITSLSLYLVAWSCHKKTYKTIYTFVWLTPFTTLFVAYLTNLLGITGTYWCYSTLILYYFMMSERQAWISNIIFALVNIPLVWHLFETHEAIRFTVTFSLVSAYSAIFLHIIAIQYSELQKMAITDKLTDVYNRTLLKDSQEQAIHQANRTNTAFTLIIMDVDHFKKINDELGHEIGDHVLMHCG
ncbi:MAG: GGDEF domain-containing protein [Candidatus Thiodiazotropha endolucinida]|nr:GGDEF domain-containing protein [Candidatus Thiodiazotropha taylori]MCW4268306.1 GGDEF domain-containing protein [Candidatus Thiodiazotropha endolucinida]